ncbi:MAG: adenylate kinase [Actinomycetota bacterium]
MRLIFLGPPGAGKGTQAARVCRHFGLMHIATGDILRRAATQETEVGRKVKALMDAGDLVPDEITNEVVAGAIALPEAAKGFVLDGYPRNMFQSAALELSLGEIGARLDKVLRFMVKGDELVARMAGRRICPKDGEVYHITARPPKVVGICDTDGTPLVQREDDSEQAVRHRLQVYGEKTKPLIDFYGKMGLVVDLDAMGTADDVFDRIIAALASA